MPIRGNLWQVWTLHTHFASSLSPVHSTFSLKKSLEPWEQRHCLRRELVTSTEHLPGYHQHHIHPYCHLTYHPAKYCTTHTHNYYDSIIWNIYMYTQVHMQTVIRVKDTCTKIWRNPVSAQLKAYLTESIRGYLLSTGNYGRQVQTPCVWCHMKSIRTHYLDSHQPEDEIFQLTVYKYSADFLWFTKNSFSESKAWCKL